MKSEQLAILKEQAHACTRCKLSTTRHQVVFGEGNENADVMFIGEGPGHQEDLSGRPFVGPAGEFLTRIIELGMGVPRSQVYIANIVKCRPTQDLQMKRDRPPDPQETASCVPFLRGQIELIQPEVIVTLGSPATKFILGTDTGITRLRGQWARFNDIPVMPTYHPSYILRQGGLRSPLRREVWEDIKKILDYLGWPIPEKR